ncbi:MAG TPA: ATP-binding protein [Micromonosporaceae bacterium]
MSTVHLLCGLNGAGKSTYARGLPAVRFGLDEWMLRLYPLRYDDPAYALHATEVQELIWETAVQVLAAGVDVVLDWNCWSRARRRQWRDRAVEAGFDVLLHHIDVRLEVAVARAVDRRDPGSHEVDEAGVRHLAALFEPPVPDEDIEIRTVGSVLPGASG